MARAARYCECGAFAGFYSDEEWQQLGGVCGHCEDPRYEDDGISAFDRLYRHKSEGE